MNYETHIDTYLFSNDKLKLQIPVIHNYLANESYWAKNIPLETLKRAIDGSLCFAIYNDKTQIGFCRVITDNATFAYLADVFIIETYRGKGLSVQFMQYVFDYPTLKKLRRFMLATKDAHTLYSKFGFTPLLTPDRFMEIKPFENY